MTEKSETMWCVKSKFGRAETEYLYTHTLSRTRQDAIKKNYRWMGIIMAHGLEKLLSPRLSVREGRG